MTTPLTSVIDHPIHRKEWLKLKSYFIIASSVCLLLGGYFCLDLAGQFANIEPESMMWYRFTHLNDRPYQYLQYGFILIGALTAACQFVPEMVGKKIRILAHLPISYNEVVLRHVGIGLLLTLWLNGLISAAVIACFHHYYPNEITQFVALDLLLIQCASFSAYLTVSACIIEPKWSSKVLKAGLGTLLTWAFALSSQTHNVLTVTVSICGLAWQTLLVKDSFLSVKTRRIDHPIFKFSLPVVALSLCLFAGFTIKQLYHVDKSQFYLFYSPTLDDFVFQHNGEHHQFRYGTSESSLSKAEFEQSLPFVYWKNLDIQGKLPIQISGRTFDKRAIRASRMSLQYQPNKLRQPPVDLYPLFNPDSRKGSIPFPEQALALLPNQFIVYDAETAQENDELSREINILSQNQKIRFPIRSVWGKTTNMKPFDWGYFIKDDNNDIYHLIRSDHKTSLNKIDLPKDVGNIEFIQVSENRHKKFYGYAISEYSKVYLIQYPDYTLLPLELDKFDYQSMSFQFLSDPLHYLLRYDDGTTYRAVLFDKNYRRLKYFEIK